MPLIHILTYTFANDYLERRIPYRDAHFHHIKPYVQNGAILLGGAKEKDNPEGIIVFKGLTMMEIESFVQNDPYKTNGVVVDYSLAKWNVVAGSLLKYL